MNVSSWQVRARHKVPSLEADLMLLTALGKIDRSELVLCAERELTLDELDMLEKMLELRQMRVPMAYLQGWKEFYGRPFRVSRDVLIPRPETEQIIDVVKQIMPEDKEKASRIDIADVGTGSGCIAITLALETGANVLAIDINEEALAVAEDNARRLGAKHVIFDQNDLLEGYCYPPSIFDIVVANLPYVDVRWEWTSPEIQYEPPDALFAENGGLSEIFALINQLTTERYLVLEADLSQHARIIEFAAARGYQHLQTTGLILLFGLRRIASERYL